MNTLTSYPGAVPERWYLDGASIVWDVTADARLPHSDHVEMSSRHVSVIVHYGVNTERRLSLSLEIIWPMLRLREGDVRGYLRRVYREESLLPFQINGKPWITCPVQQIRFDGTLRILCEAEDNIAATLVCQVLPDGIKLQTFVENVNGHPLEVTLAPSAEETTEGVYGRYTIRREASIPFAGFQTTAVYRQVRAFVTPPDGTVPPVPVIGTGRLRWVEAIRNETLILQTPDDAINAAFSFAKVRAAESLFATRMGLVHSPGGGRYYAGIWNNDQCEYSGPLFGYLGDTDAQRAALTAYRNFAAYMTPEFKTIPTSLEMEGTIPFSAGGDRGDASMYASGAARFALAVGDPAIARELYTPICWCLEYTHRKLNAAGVPESDCDELENRFPAGDANLSTASLYYDGLRRAADLATALGHSEDAAVFTKRAHALNAAIEEHFGANIEDFETYRYYDGNTTLRAWICLPLVFGLASGARRSGTLDALFSERLWGPDGLATEAGKPDFWDRSTLYALRGAFAAGDTERALAHLTAYTRRRLFGEHVPYPVEAYPEGNQAHLSAESALYCRVITEGMFGLVPVGLGTFSLTPRLPGNWDRMSLRKIAIGGQLQDIVVYRASDGTVQSRMELAS